MAKTAILYCKRIRDHSCVACAKCFKGIDEKNGTFAQDDDIELVALTDCGDCPGLVVPRVKLLTGYLKGIDRKLETVYLGTCVKIAMDTAKCPIDLDEVSAVLQKKFGVKVVLGTHNY